MNKFSGQFTYKPQELINFFAEDNLLNFMNYDEDTCKYLKEK